MQRPVQITFKDIDHSDSIESRVRQRVEKLEAISDEIVGCIVRVRAPHRHHKATQYVVDVNVQMPGSALHVDRRPGDDEAHTDVYVAIRDAFDATERKLREWAAKHKGRPETLNAPLQGRIVSLDGYKGNGQIATTDGRLIYFHRNSVVNDGFDDLNEDDSVELSVDSTGSDEGPHASIVRPISSMRFVDKPG